MSLDSAIFRRGGPKRELFDVTSEDADKAELEEKLREWGEVLTSQAAV